MRLGLRRPGLIQKDLAQNAVRDWIAGVALQFSPELLLGEVVVAFSPILEAQAGMHTHERWICFCRRLIFLDGLRSIRHLVIGCTHHDVSRCGVWT